MKAIFTCMFLMLLTVACSKQQSQSEYGINEVGQYISAEYAIVFSVRPVDITGESATTAAAGASPIGASIGGMTGPAGTYVGGELGGLWGSGINAAEEVATEKKGYEYTLVTEGGATKTIVQYQNAKDIVFKPGDLVLVQSTGTFHRVLSTANLPENIKEPHRLKISNPPVCPAAAPTASTTPPPAPAEPAKKPAE